MNIGRPLQFDPDQALNSAMQLFWRKGYESTSLQDLLEVMGLSKSSFYQTFKSKGLLFECSIKNYQNQLVDILQSRLAQADSGKSFLKDLFFDVANETSGSDARRGCLLMNTANEFAQTDADIACLVSDSLDEIIAIFKQAIQQAQEKNEIDHNKDAYSLAVYLVSTMSGLKNMVKAGADRKTINSIVEISLSVLD